MNPQPFDWRLQAMEIHTAAMDLSAVLEQIDRYCQQVGPNPVVDEIQAIMRGERPTVETVSGIADNMKRQQP